MYLEHTLILDSFRRLRTSVVGGKRGKTPMERTSSLMTMLAVDATAKKFGVSALDVDFGKPQSKQMRQEMALQYAKLVAVSKAEDGRLQSVHELGRVAVGGKDPEQRLSSNFLTTQLVDATKSEAPLDYPRRPAPLLHLGKIASGVCYGIRLHPQWRVGIAQHLADVSSSTPYTDLAIFCMRFQNAVAKPTLTETLCSMLHERFSDDVAEFWSTKVIAEKMLAKHLDRTNFMEDALVDSLAGINNLQTRRTELMALDKAELVEIIIRLEAQR